MTNLLRSGGTLPKTTKLRIPQSPFENLPSGLSLDTKLVRGLAKWGPAMILGNAFFSAERNWCRKITGILAKGKRLSITV